MKELNEWAFDLTVVTAESQSNSKSLGEIILSIATTWAEDKSYGIGGGFQVSQNMELISFHFSFGLCVTQKGQLIPAKDAEQLLFFLTEKIKAFGASCIGCFREYTDEEKGPITAKSISRSRERKSAGS